MKGNIQLQIRGELQGLCCRQSFVFLQIYDLCGELAGACVITAYTLIYTSLLIIWGGLQRADANTSPLSGPAGREGTLCGIHPTHSLSACCTGLKLGCTSGSIPGPLQSSANRCRWHSYLVWVLKAGFMEIRSCDHWTRNSDQHSPLANKFHSCESFTVPLPQPILCRYPRLFFMESSTVKLQWTGLISATSHSFSRPI